MESQTVKTLKIVTLLLAGAWAIATMPAKALDAMDCVRFEAKPGFDRIYNDCNMKINVSWRTHHDRRKGLGVSLTTVQANDYTNISDFEDRGGVYEYAACIDPKYPYISSPGRFSCR